MTDKKNISGKSEGKKEAAYPLYPLDEALKVAEAVRDMGGSRASVSKAILAKHLGYAETGPSFVQRIASAKTFGLIDGWGNYSLTELAKKYFYPTNESEKNEALLSFLSSPSIFWTLIKRFDGERLPDNQMIGNILHNESNIPDSWKDRMASLFVRSAQFVGIIDANGILRYAASMKTAPAIPIVETAENTPKDPLSGPAWLTPQPSDEAGANTWCYGAKGNQIKVLTPEKLSKELWEKLNAYVQILKPMD